MNKRVALLAALVGGLFLAFVFGAAPVAAADPQIRVIHGSPDAPAVDIYVDGKKAINLAFPNASPYLSIPVGPHDLQVFAAGADATKDKPVIDAKGVQIPADAKLSIVASGKLATIKPLIVNDTTAPPASGKVKIRFVHNSPDAPAVDIAVKGGPVLFANTTFGNAYPYMEVDAKSYDLEVRAAGTMNVVLTVPGIVLQSGQVVSIYAQGLAGGTGVQSLRAVLYVDSANATGGGAAIMTPVGTPAATRPAGATVAATPATGGAMLPRTGRPAETTGTLPFLLLVGAGTLVATGVVLRRRTA